MAVVHILIFSVLLAEACTTCCCNVMLMCINARYLDGPTIFMLPKISNLWIKWQSSIYTTVSSAAINLYSTFTYAHWWVTIVPVSSRDVLIWYIWMNKAHLEWVSFSNYYPSLDAILMIYLISDDQLNFWASFLFVVRLVVWDGNLVSI